MALVLGGAGIATLGAARLGGGLFDADPPPTTNGAPDVPQPTGAPLRRGPVIDVRDVGAVADGTTDDGAAIREGLAQAAARRGTLYLPAGRYAYRIGEVLAPPAGVTLAGDPGRSVVRLLAPRDRGSGTFADPAGAGVIVDGLVIERVEDFACVLFTLSATGDFTLSRVSFVGHLDRFPSNYCHGVQLGVRNGSTTTGFTWTDSVVTTMSFGLFQTNDSTAATEDVEVSRCRFIANANTDLEFNSPRGATRRVTVRGCQFRDHGTAGFAVGLATCTDVVLEDNSISGYPREAIHVEDYSRNVTISGNTVSASGLEEYSHVQLIGGASDVTVRGNTFDATMNTNEITVVHALAGGTSPTPGGRPVAPPSRVEVLDNSFALAEGVRAIAFEGVAGGAVRGNRLTGPGAPPDTPGSAIGVEDSDGVIVDANRSGTS